MNELYDEAWGFLAHHAQYAEIAYNFNHSKEYIVSFYLAVRG